MKKITLDPERAEAAAQLAAQAMREGGVVVFPAERLYGLAVDAANSAAVRRVFELKGRDPGQPLPVIVGDAGAASEWVVIPPELEALVRRFWPGPLTLVLPVRRQLAPELSARTELGIRVPGGGFALEMARAFGAPVTATSANESGRASGRTVAEALDGLRGGADLVIDAGELAGPPGSTVARYRDYQLEILRPGIIPVELLEQTIPRSA